jgi:beta-glucosidase
MLTFPQDFVWGVATSSIQIEGAVDADGKSDSVWDTYARTSGRIRDGSTPEPGAHSYRRYADDVRCMCDLGVRAYRFSLAWPRVQPDGRGALNRQGLDYYHRLIDCLLEHDIAPWITLYHWDLPQVLEDAGGWRERWMVDLFAHYAEAMVQEYGDRVKHWITFNEIHAFVGQGYGDGWKAPGLCLPAAELAQIYHHVLLAHGAAITAMRAQRPGLQIGTAEHPQPPVPAIATPEHIAAASRAYDERIGFLFQPMALGSYPDGLAHYPTIEDGDMESINQPLDFWGFNMYTGPPVVACDQAPGYRILPLPEYHPHAPTQGWLRLMPEAMYWGVRFAQEKYGPLPVYFMENGFSTPSDAPDEADRDDVTRIVFIRAYLRALHETIAEGYPVKGYFLWSLMDSFEWVSGYTCRFGLYRTDFETGKRTPRLSAEWYREVIRSNSLV